MPEKNNVVDFDKASEPLVHKRRDRKLAKMRTIFKSVRESFGSQKKRPTRANTKKQPKDKKK
jgi:hypothetical protein